MNSESNIEHDKDEQIFLFEKSGSITLPLSEEDFKEFISGLLGKPQTIEGTIEGKFELTPEDIKHIYHTIDQRIAQQNDGHLISFNARIIYSDKSSVLVNSLLELATYSQLKPVICEGLHLTFQYLIKFADKKVPEKQEINISFVAKFDDEENLRIEPSIVGRAILPFVRRDKIQFTIKHTARTWGADIEALLSNVLTGVIINENKYLYFIRRYKVLLLIGIFILTIFYSFTLSSEIDAANEALRGDNLNKIFAVKSENFQHIDEKLQELAKNNFFVDKSKLREVPLIIGIFGGLIIVFLLAFILDENDRKSHILLSAESIKYKEKTDREYQRNWLIFFVTISVTIVANVFSNYIYDKLFK